MFQKKVYLRLFLFLGCLFLIGKSYAMEPNAPTGLSINQAPNEFTLTWNNDPSATIGFNIYITENGVFKYVTTVAPGSTSYTYSGTQGGIAIVDGNTYTATVQALPDTNENAYANSGLFNLNSTDPLAPTGLSITQASNEFTLSWDNIPLATGGFNLYINEGNSTELATTLPAGSTSYTYTGTYGGITVADGNTYKAIVQALPDANNNASTNSDSFGLNVPDPETPKVTTVTKGNNEFTLNWINQPNATHYNIYITENDITKYVTTIPAGSTSYTFSGALGNTGITITNNGIYNASVQALPDANNNAYGSALVYMNNPVSVPLSEVDPNFHIYVAFGQSNMEGNAPIESVDYASDDRFLSLQSLDCSNLGREKNKWYPAAPPASQCLTQLSLVNSFGKNMILNQPNNIKVGIVHVAVGGSDIRLFDKDKYLDYDTSNEDPFFEDKIIDYGGNPYQHLIDLALIAKQHGVIKGILLHQGEANANKADTNQWPNYVKTVYENMLTDLSLNANDVPLLAGEVGHANNGGLVSSMNTTIATLPSVIPTAHVISSVGCSILADNVHFDSSGVRELGKRYAEKMLALENPPVQDPMVANPSEALTIEGNQFKRNGRTIFLNGLNSPWQDDQYFRIDFLGTPHFDEAFWINEFKNMEENHVNTARIWIHGRGNNTPAYDTFGFTLPPTQDFYDDLEFIVNLAEEKKIYIIFNMWSFDMVQKSGFGQPGSNNHIENRNTMTDDVKTNSYLTNFLEPVVTLYKDNPYILAFEVINEPEAIWENDNDLVDNAVSRNDVISFVAKTAAKIHQASNNQKYVTVGSKWMIYNSDLFTTYPDKTSVGDNYTDTSLQTQFNSTDAYLDFYSMHWYQWQSTGSPFKQTVNALYPGVTKPVIIAEYPGLDLPNNDCGCACNTLPACDFNLTIAQAYEDIKDNGFAGITAWKNGGEDDNFGKSAKIYEATKAFGNANSDLVFPDPNAPTGLQVSDYTSNSFTLTWDTDIKAVNGTHLFIADGDITTPVYQLVTTVNTDVNSFTFSGSYGNLNIDLSKKYILRLQALPDSDKNATSEITTEPAITLSNASKNLDNTQISIFPNPSTDTFNVINLDNSNFEYVQVLNYLGQVLLTSTSPTVNIQNLYLGNYIVIIKTKNKTITKHLIKR